MKKKFYQQPEMKVMELRHMGIICTSTSTSQFPTSQNESYDEVDESVTDGWY